MTKRRPKRWRVRVQWWKFARTWLVSGDGVADWPCTTKRKAIAWGADCCRALWKRNHPAQLIIHNKNGKIARNGERTYGRDPYPPAG